MKTNMSLIQVPTSENTLELRRCFRPPVPEISLAARLLEDAVTAHLLGHVTMAEELIRMADFREIKEWTDSIWGKASPYVQYRKVGHASPMLQAEERVKRRMPSESGKRMLLQRDGYHCRFCDIPLVRSEIRKLLQGLYPAALRWGGTNATQHAAFEAMWVQYDHILPHARGGDNSLENLLITCAPCNYGRMDKTLAEVGLQDPRDREPFRSDWDGLERMLSAQVRSKAIEIEEGLVDRASEYFELRLGSSAESWDEWLLVAIVGLVDTHTANVEFLIKREDERYLEATKKPGSKFISTSWN